MNEHQRKVMPRIEFQRIADDAVITQVWPDGTRQQLTMPLDQALILADWIVGSAEDHQQAAAPDPHPLPEPGAETGEGDGCTRTRGVEPDIPYVCSGCGVDFVAPVPLFRKNCPLCTSGTLRLNRAEAPVTAIADGEVRRA